MKTFSTPIRKRTGLYRHPAPRMPRLLIPTVQRAEIRHILHGSRLQAKLTIGAPDDAYEREADRVADAVMRMPEPEERVRRVCPECEEEVRRQPVEEPEEEETEELRRQPEEEEEPEEEEIVAAKSRPGGVPEIGRGLETRIQALRGGGQPLPQAERAFFEPRLGRDFGSVRLHDDSRAAELAQSVHARAFTVGRDIVFGEGEYRPGTTPGRSLLAHELTHVMQQRSEGLQRAVRFRANFSNVSLSPIQGASLTGGDYEHDYADFSADANVVATGDTAAELDQWDVGVLQDMVVNWEREYWRRNNADRQGRFVEQKFRPIHTRFRDQEDGASTVWSADSEHQLLSALPKTPRGTRFEVSTTINTSDVPSGGDTLSGSSVAGMGAADGVRNVNIERTGTRFDTYISAHNTVTGAWRHLRRLNWNYMKSLDFRGSGAALSVGPTNARVGRHGPYRAGRRAPLLTGPTANAAVGNAANWTRRRVRGWT